MNRAFHEKSVDLVVDYLRLTDDALAANKLPIEALITQ